LAAACAQTPSSTSEESEAPATAEGETVVVGSLTYRQKIALPQTATATISVYGPGPQDIVAEPLEQESFALNGRQVPVPFQVTIRDSGAVDAYTLRAQIRSANGELIWSTDEVLRFAADGADEDLGLVTLVPAGSTRVSSDDLAGHDWMVAELDGQTLMSGSRITMTFSEDGRISGHASCNNFTGSYKVINSMLSIGPLAMTRKACVPALMEQEQAFIDLLESVDQLNVDPAGMLTISSDSGRTLTAR
jgi:putative lipoprotein